MKIEKRSYEERAVRAIGDELAEHRRVLAVAPTGAGKTVMASLLVQRVKRWRKVLWLAHRYELVDQAYQTLKALGLDVGIVMAQEELLHGAERANSKARVQVASIQTVSARGAPNGVDLIIVDEAHRIMADSYQRIAETVPEAQILGLTATPCRLDGRGLGVFFAHMHIAAKPSDLYEQGYLARPRTFGAPADVIVELNQRLKGIRLAHGDYLPGMLGRAVSTSKLVGSVVDESMRIAPNVPKVVFASGILHSERLAEAFGKNGIRAAHLDAMTEPERRKRLLDGLGTGAVEVLCNVDVLTEGWDLPALGAVILARPTKSLGRFLQMTGRVQRPYEGKAPIIIDHGNNWLRFQVLTDEDIAWNLEAGYEAREGEALYKACPWCNAGIPAGCTVCPACSAELPILKVRRERDEVDAQLVEITQARLVQFRARIDAMAKKKNAPEGWAERVMKAVS